MFNDSLTLNQVVIDAKRDIPVVKDGAFLTVKDVLVTNSNSYSSAMDLIDKSNVREINDIMTILGYKELDNNVYVYEAVKEIQVHTIFHVYGLPTKWLESKMPDSIACEDVRVRNMCRKYLNNTSDQIVLEVPNIGANVGIHPMLPYIMKDFKNTIYSYKNQLLIWSIFGDYKVGIILNDVESQYLQVYNLDTCESEVMREIKVDLSNVNRIGELVELLRSEIKIHKLKHPNIRIQN